MNLEHRRAYKQSMPQARLDYVHTEQCRLLPDRSSLLERLPRNGIAAEIGVAFGDYTVEILQRNRPKTLYLIDSWDTERFQAGLKQIATALAQPIRDGSVVIRQGYSIEKLLEIEDDFFDWVYIDTDHSFSNTFKELVLCDRKVKRHGRIAGHDFCTGNVVDPVPYGVIEACNKFCVDCGWQFEYLTLESHGHFSFCLKRM